MRTDEDFAADPRLVPGSSRRRHNSVPEWNTTISSTSAIVICQKGRKLSEGVAAWLRYRGISADVLEGGFEAWSVAGSPTVPDALIPPRDKGGRSVWVTPARPKIDRIACP